MRKGKPRRDERPSARRKENAGYDEAVRGSANGPKLDVMVTSANPARKLKRDDVFDRAARGAVRDVRRRERT
jgi:hypothetical protein